MWSAGEKIDLTSRGAELVRATIESAKIGNSAGVEFTYPGYREAQDGADPKSDTGHRIGTDRDYDTWREIGKATYYNYIANISNSGRIIEAKICEYSTVEPSRYSATAGFAIYVVRLENTKEADQGQPGNYADADDLGRRTPDWNVFGSWRIAELYSAGESEKEPECQNWFKSRVPELIVGEYLGSSGPLARMPDGVEIPREPVQPQYPKWLRPE